MKRSYERYRQLFTEHRQKFESPIDRPSDYSTKYDQLHNSEILHGQWTQDEKERFFTALSRCGKGNLSEIAKRIGTKSLAQVAAYIGLLDEATEWKKQSSKRKRFFDHAKIPGAVEVDDEWLEFEEKAAEALSKKETTTVIQDLEGENFVLDIEKANELAQWYACFWPADKGTKICYRTAKLMRRYRLNLSWTLIIRLKRRLDGWSTLLSFSLVHFPAMRNETKIQHTLRSVMYGPQSISLAFQDISGIISQDYQLEWNRSARHSRAQKTVIIDN
jgi:hypothetical protein